MGRQTYYYGGEPQTLTREQTAVIAYRAGFRGDDLWKAVAIAGRESGYKYNVHGSERPHSEYSGDRGLFQINYVNDGILRDAGIIQNRQDLFDPLVNARAAFLLYQRAGNSFAPAWSVGPNGWDGRGDPLYKTNPTAAKEAVSRVQAAGLLKDSGGRDVGWRDLVGGVLGNLPNQIPTPVGPIPNPLGDGNIIPGLPNPFGFISGVDDFVKALANYVLNRSWWIRVLQVIGGGVLVLLGINVMLSGMVTDVVAGQVGKVVPSAPAVAT